MSRAIQLVSNPDEREGFAAGPGGLPRRAWHEGHLSRTNGFDFEAVRAEEPFVLEVSGELECRRRKIADATTVVIRKAASRPRTGKSSRRQNRNEGEATL